MLHKSIRPGRNSTQTVGVRLDRTGIASSETYCHSLYNTVTEQPPRARPKNPVLEADLDMFQLCWGWTESCSLTPDQSSPTSSIYHHSIATKLVAILDRKVEQLGLLVIPLHQRHRVGGCEKGKSQSYSNCHLPNVITFQLSSAPRPFSSGTDQRSVRHHVTESSQRRWKEFRFCAWAWSIVAANCCG